MIQDEGINDPDLSLSLDTKGLLLHLGTVGCLFFWPKNDKPTRAHRRCNWWQSTSRALAPLRSSGTSTACKRRYS